MYRFRSRFLFTEIKVPSNVSPQKIASLVRHKSAHPFTLQPTPFYPSSCSSSEDTCGSGTVCRWDRIYEIGEEIYPKPAVCWWHFYWKLFFDRPSPGKLGELFRGGCRGGRSSLSFSICLGADRGGNGHERRPAGDAPALRTEPLATRKCDYEDWSSRPRSPFIGFRAIYACFALNSALCRLLHKLNLLRCERIRTMGQFLPRSRGIHVTQ